MIKIDVRADISKAIAKLSSIAKDQVPYATARALTATAKIVQKNLKSEMERAFDRPTRYTLNSLYTKSATKTNLEARVWLKDDAGKGTRATDYLSPEIYGGQRKLKRFERALNAYGLLPSGMNAVPGSAAKIDQYGNMSRGQIMQILSALGTAEIRSGYSANRTKTSGKKRAQFFVGKPGDKAPLGVWQRFGFAQGSAVKPVIIFVKKVAYSKRFKFFEVGHATIKREFPIQFKMAMEQALRTAR